MAARPDPSADACSEARRLVRAQMRIVDTRVTAWLAGPGDRDALHDARTALRRLRVFVRSFRADLGSIARKGVRRRLRDTFKTSSALRDLDVFAAWLVTVPASRARQRLLATADAEARQHAAVVAGLMRHGWRAARRRLNGARCDGGAGRRRPRGFGRAAAGAIRAEIRAIEGGLARFDPARAAADAHRTRIAAKRLRYLVEALSGRSPDARRVVEWCRAFQDLVGEWRDSTLASTRVRRCIPMPGRDAVVLRLRERRRAALVELRDFVADRGAWQVAQRDALAIARRYALGSTGPERRHRGRHSP